MRVGLISKQEAIRLVVEHHYMHRRPPVSFALGLFDGDETKGVVTFGTPASHHMLVGACADTKVVIELNGLWVHDSLPRNTESWFVSRALALLPPKIVLSYADTAAGHLGYIYRALNFNYAGWTDMERKTPRFDYIAPGKHSRDAFRNGYTDRVRRKPKVKYWITTGNRRERKQLEAQCLWPKMDWKLACLSGLDTQEMPHAIRSSYALSVPRWRAQNAARWCQLPSGPCVYDQKRL